MEEDKNIDKLFRQAIEPFEMDPPEHVWNSLDEKLNARRPGRGKRTVLWISSIAALFILTAGSYLYFSNSLVPSGSGSGGGNVSSAPASTNPASPGSELQQTQSPSTEVSSITQGQNAGQKGALQEGNAGANTLSEETASDNRRSSIQSSSLGKGNVNGSQASGVAAAKKPSQGTQPSPGTSAAANGNRNHATDQSRGVAGAVAASTLASGNSQPASSGKITSERQSGESGIEQPVSQQVPPAAAAVVPENASSANVTEAEAVQTENTSATQTDAGEPVQSEKKAQETAALETVTETKAAADSIVDYKEDKKSGKWFNRFIDRLSVDLYYSPDLAQRRLSVNETYTGPGASEGSAFYNNIEKPEYSYSTGARFRADISSHWSVATGVYYSTFSQTSDMDNIYVVSDSAFQHDYGMNQPGTHHGPGPGPGQGPGQGPGGPGCGPRPGGYNQHYVVHTSCGTISLQNQPFPHPGPGGTFEHYIPEAGDTLNVDIQSTELIQFISIPLTVRYQVDKQHWAFYGEAGASVNFIYDNKVTVNVDNSYTETNDIVGLKNTNYSILLSAGALYKIQPHWGLFAEPTLRYSLTSINEKSPVLSYPYFLGLKMGVSYHF